MWFIGDLKKLWIFINGYVLLLLENILWFDVKYLENVYYKFLV